MTMNELFELACVTIADRYSLGMTIVPGSVQARLVGTAAAKVLDAAVKKASLKSGGCLKLHWSAIAAEMVTLLPEVPNPFLVVNNEDHPEKQ